MVSVGVSGGTFYSFFKHWHWTLWRSKYRKKSPTTALSHEHCTHTHPYKCTRCPHSKHLIVWYSFNSSLLGHDVEWLVFLWGWCLVLRSAWLKIWMSNSQLWIEEVPQIESVFLTRVLCLCLVLWSERAGKVAPSVFSGVRTGKETVLDQPTSAKAPGASVFSKWSTLQPETKQIAQDEHAHCWLCASDSETFKCVLLPALMKNVRKINWRQMNVVHCYDYILWKFFLFFYLCSAFS